MKKIIIILILLLPCISSAATISLKRVGNKTSVCITSDERVYTISVNLSKATSFKYNSEVLVLDVPEYNNPTKKTAGFPGGFVGTQCLGSFKGMNNSIVGGLVLNQNSDNVYVK